ncbi:MAG: recombinase family protein [Sphingobacteriales bacterium]|nr:MAG: recombinase family protein [Sphingobacteriales bacterium]
MSFCSCSNAGQRQQIDQWLDGNGTPPETRRWYVDKESGDTLARPAFEQLQKDIFAGRIGTVVVWRLDRLSRKLRDGLQVLCDWCERGLRVVSVTQQIDFNGTVGKIIAAVLLGVGQMEQEARRDRQQAGIKAAKTLGVYKGRKPGSLKAKPARVKELRAKGLQQDEIATALGISRSTVNRYLRTDM